MKVSYAQHPSQDARIVTFEDAVKFSIYEIDLLLRQRGGEHTWPTLHLLGWRVVDNN